MLPIYEVMKKLSVITLLLALFIVGSMVVAWPRMPFVRFALSRGIPEWRFVLSHRVPECTLWESIRDHAREKHRGEEIQSVPRRLVRTEGDLQLWAIPQGEFWVDRRGASSVARMGLPTRYGHFDGDRVVRAGDIVLDCGAYIGDTASEALRLGASLVVAIEPSPPILECLRRNLRNEIRTGRVIVYDKGVWDREEVLRFQEGEISAADHIEPAGTRSIPVTTIDRIVEELGLKKVDVIKMDIEGAEQRALMGARKTINTFRPRLILGSYHLKDDYYKIPTLVREMRSDYNMQSARCLPGHARIMPNVVYFF